MTPTDCDLTPTQMHLLHALYYKDDKKEGIPVSIISNLMKTTSSATTQTIGALEDLGLISRRMSTKDRRIILVSITTKGTQLVRSFDKQAQKILGELIDYLGIDQTKDFIDILHKISDFLKEKNFTKERTEAEKCSNS